MGVGASATVGVTSGAVGVVGGLLACGVVRRGERDLSWAAALWVSSYGGAGVVVSMVPSCRSCVMVCWKVCGSGVGNGGG